MDTNEKALQKLLQLKKLETPGPAYFEAFLDEFHRYQRVEWIQKRTVLERLTEYAGALWVSEPRKLWACGGSFAALMLVVTLSLGGYLKSAGLNYGSPVAHSVSAAAAQGFVETEAAPAAQSDLQLVSASAFEKDFSSPRYVTGQTPLSYDKAFAF